VELAPPAEPSRSDAPTGQPKAGAPRASPETVVRLFRRDLNVRRLPSSPLIEVGDPRTGKVFPLYDFEISLARMLDGRRHYSEVVEAGQRLGIPVNLESLAQFIRQLDQYGFLAPPGAQMTERTEGGMWAPRQKWDEGLRALFQSGLRMHRQGRYAEAINYFEAMLEQDSQNPEALEMLEQSRQRMTGASAAKPELLLAPSDSGQVSLEKLLEEDDEPSPETRVEVVPLAPPAPSVARPKAGVWNAERTPAPPPRRKIRWAPLAIALGAVAAVSCAAFYLFSLEFETSSSAARIAFKKRSRAAAKPAPAGSPDGGIAQIAVARADPSQMVTTLPRRADATPSVAPKAMLDAGAGTPSDAVSASRPSAADAGLSDDDSQRWIAGKIERRGRVTMGEVIAPSKGTVVWKASTQQRVRRGDAIGVLEDKSGSSPRTLLAPKDGLFVPKVADHAEVRAAEVLAAIVYHEAYLQALVATARPEPAWVCEVFQPDPGERASCRIIGVIRRGTNSFVTATTEPMWFDSAKDAVLRLSPPH
jgi:hypothetical protein